MHLHVGNLAAVPVGWALETAPTAVVSSTVPTDPAAMLSIVGFQEKLLNGFECKLLFCQHRCFCDSLVLP